MIGVADLDRVVAANRYLVLATADENGQPWATPVFFAPFGPQAMCWVSSPTSRHSRNIAVRPQIAITVYDSTVDIGRGEAAYFDADAASLDEQGVEVGLRALNQRLPQSKRLTDADLQPSGPLMVYGAELRHRYLLVRGGDAEYGNEVDTTVEL